MQTTSNYYSVQYNDRWDVPSIQRLVGVLRQWYLFWLKKEGEEEAEEENASCNLIFHLSSGLFLHKRILVFARHVGFEVLAWLAFLLFHSAHLVEAEATKAIKELVGRRNALISSGLPRAIFYQFCVHVYPRRRLMQSGNTNAFILTFLRWQFCVHVVDGPRGNKCNKRSEP